MYTQGVMRRRASNAVFKTTGLSHNTVVMAGSRTPISVANAAERMNRERGPTVLVPG
jgi:hypothetical protein